MEEIAAVKSEGSMVAVSVGESCVTATTSVPPQIVTGGSPSRLPELSANCPSPGEVCANERLSGPSLNTAGGTEESSAAAIASQYQDEASPQGTKR
jgi:hypothetical protein